MALACADQTAPAGSPLATAPVTTPGAVLAGTSWDLTLLDGRPLIAGTHINLEVDGDSAGGFTGCNGYGARLDAEANQILADGTFQLKESVMTLIGCLEPEGIGDQESKYMELLRRGARFEVVADRLIISDDSGSVILEYTRSLNPAMDPALLVGTVWRLTSIDGASPEYRATIAFNSAARASGDAGCRAFVAGTAADGNRLSFNTMAMIGEVCDDLARARFEGDFTTMLEWTRHYVIEGSTLQLKTARGEILKFERSSVDGQIRGVQWELAALVEANGVTVRVPLAGPIPTIEFGENRVTGAAGCNDYTADHTGSAGSINLGPVAATKKACMAPDGIMVQESDFLNALAATVRAEVHNGRLWLTATDGSALVFTTGASKQ